MAKKNEQKNTEQIKRKLPKKWAAKWVVEVASMWATEQAPW